MCGVLGFSVPERYLQAKANSVGHQDGFGPESGKTEERIESTGNVAIL